MSNRNEKPPAPARANGGAGESLHDIAHDYAERGIRVRLLEQKPQRRTPAQVSDAPTAPASEGTTGGQAGNTQMANATTGASDNGKGKILYYRHPMGLPEISYEPKKDSMGMDYIPVYENEAAASADTVQVSLDKVQKLGVKTEPAMLRDVMRTVRAVGTVQHEYDPY